MTMMASSGNAAAPTQIPSLQADPNSTDPFSLAVDVGMANNPITFGDSSDDSNGDGSISKVNNNNNEIVSFYIAI